MASSVSASSILSQASKRTHAEMSSPEVSSQQSTCAQTSLPAQVLNSAAPGPKVVESNSSLSRDAEIAVVNHQNTDAMNSPPNSSHNSHAKENVTSVTNVTQGSENCLSVKQSQQPSCNAAKASSESHAGSSKSFNPADSPAEAKMPSVSAGRSPPTNSWSTKDTKKVAEEPAAADSALAPSLQVTSGSSTVGAVSGAVKSEPVEISAPEPGQSATAKIKSVPAASSDLSKHSESTSNYKPQLEDGEEPEKKAKVVSASSKEGGRAPEQILECMDKTFEQRRKVITKQMPAIPELKVLYPDLFTGKQLLLEFQRITKIDIDQKIQEFCVRYATAVIEMARNKKAAAPVLARWEQAKQENDALRQYWDMVTALCLLPLHLGENFVEMVLEIGEDEEVVPQGKIVPTLIARGNIFRTDEFFLIAENTIVQEFEEFTIAFASLYSSYWVFNMEYPETIENTYSYIQRCIVRQREPGTIPTVCKNFTKALLKWNKGSEGK